MKMSKEKIFKYLAEVKDPEIPILDIVEMGIVRDVQFEEKTLQIDITPTYMGCPAMKLIEDEIIAALNRKGFDKIFVNTVLSPAWTTDWLSKKTRQKLKEYGIAPPDKFYENDANPSKRITRAVNCPFCDSPETELKSEFGSTACKSLFFCNNCRQPFEHFKCH